MDKSLTSFTNIKLINLNHRQTDVAAPPLKKERPQPFAATQTNSKPMKKTSLIAPIAICLLLLIAGACRAQEAGIRFQTLTWENTLKQAQQTRKMIFLDCYTSWCGPCKMLARTTFKNDTVATLFNDKFVCIQMDMEKGEGPALAKRYAVNAYPTLLFLTPDGTLKHSVVGFMNAQKLLTEAQTALQGEETLSAYLNRYTQGERDEKFIRALLNKLYKGGRSDLQSKVATELINTFSDKQFYTRDCWSLIVYHISDPMSPILQKVIAKRFRFERIIARDTVSMFLNYALGSKANRYLWMGANNPKFNPQEFEAYTAYLKSIRDSRTPIYLATLYTAKQLIKGNYRGMVEEMKKAFWYSIFQGDDKVQFVHACMIQLSKSKQSKLIQECITWMQQLADEETTGYYKSEYMKAEATLLKALGRQKEADALTEEARRVRMK